MLIAFAVAAAFGAAYPGATLDSPMEQGQCLTRYRFTTSDPVTRVAAFLHPAFNLFNDPVASLGGEHMPLLIEVLIVGRYTGITVAHLYSDFSPLPSS